MAEDAPEDRADQGLLDDRTTDPSLERRVGDPGGPPPPDEAAIRDWSRAELLQHAEALGLELDPGQPREALIEAILSGR